MEKEESRKTLNLNYVVDTTAPTSSFPWSFLLVIVGFVAIVGASFYFAQRRNTERMHVHCVQPQETLSTLASFYYQNPKKWRKIYLANRKQIMEKDLVENDQLKTGQNIFIPLSLEEEKELLKRLNSLPRNN